MGLFLKVVHEAYRLSLARSYQRYDRQINRPGEVQGQRLKNLLAKNKTCKYGRKFRFSEIRSIKDFQTQVPLVDYDQLEPWVQEIVQGEKQVLTDEPVVMVEKSGGSTSTSKWIPYTKSLLSEISASTEPWLYDLYTQFPSIKGTTSYWAVSPSTHLQEKTPGGLPVGFQDDTEYFGPLSQWLVRKSLAVPPDVAQISDMKKWRQSTVSYLVKARDLGVVSVWSPTFLLLLLEELENNWSTYKALLPPRFCDQLEAQWSEHQRLPTEMLWPQLRLISCWADGVSHQFLPDIRRLFPQVHVQPKGLLATEGVVSIPLEQAGGSVAAITGHFLEFLDLNGSSQQTRLVQDLKVGAQYSPVLTTGGGFYRYHLKDVVECVGQWGDTPLLKFLGKLDKVGDICGEKVNARQVELALAQAEEKWGWKPTFALLAPVYDGKPPFYRLYLESSQGQTQEQELAGYIENHLATGHHYKYCRDVGQLGPVRVCSVKNGWRTYQSACVELGQRAGDIKPSHFDLRPVWTKAFEAT